MTTENKPFELVDEIDILYEGQNTPPILNTPPGLNTPPVQNEFKIKPAPLKAKAKRIQLQKISSTKIKESFDYGLQSIPRKNGQLVISSTLGSYGQYYDEDGEKPTNDGQGEYIEEMDNWLLDVKPKVRAVKGEDQKEANREELFKEIEALDNLANLSLSSKLKGDMSGNRLPAKDTTQMKTPEPKEFCGVCNIHVTNKEKHTAINKCVTYPFPLTKELAKPSSTKKNQKSSKSHDNPAQSL